MARYRITIQVPQTNYIGYLSTHRGWWFTPPGLSGKWSFRARIFGSRSEAKRARDRMIDDGYEWLELVEVSE
jgi:hypothetical protein